MYPFDDKNETHENGWYANENRDESPRPQDDADDAPLPQEDIAAQDETPASQKETDAQDEGGYRLIRPDAGRSYYRDASYIPQGESAVPGVFRPADRSGEPEKAARKKGGMSFAKVACLCLVCALLGGVSGGLIAGGKLNGTAEPTPNLTQTASPTPTATQLSNSGVSANDIYELGCRQTVGITTEITTRNVFGMTASGSISGSGFIISADGYIMTNYHVIEDAYKGGYEVKVMLNNGETYAAEIVGFRRDNDIAVLKIDATELSAVSFGSSEDLSVGNTVYAIGNPLGELSYSMTSGIVSATDRVITTDENTSINMFQFDAAVNSGNSGGPVYNDAGQVVGVVTAKYSETGVEGLGFAIPVDDAVRLANDIISGSAAAAESGNAMLNITAKSVDTAAIMYYNMPAGAYVVSVGAGGCAEQAGVKIGDIITELGGYSVTSKEDLVEELSFHSAGETAELVVWRSGEYLTLSITFDERSEESTAQQPESGWQYGYGYGQ